MLRATILSSLIFSLVSFNAVAETDSEASVTVWGVDTAGRTPFERRTMEVPAADVVRFNLEPVEPLELHRADFNNELPFVRGRDGVPIMDIQFEQDFGPGPELVFPKPMFNGRNR